MRVDRSGHGRIHGGGRTPRLLRGAFSGAPHARTYCTLGSGFDLAPAHPVDERGAPVLPAPPTPARTPSPTSTMHFCHPRIRVVHIRTRRDVGAARSGARTTTTTTGHTVDNVYPSAELIPGQLAQGAADSLRRDAVVEGQTSSGKSSGQDRVNHSQPPSRNSRRTRGPRSAWDAKGILGVQSASERSANGKSDAA